MSTLNLIFCVCKDTEAASEIERLGYPADEAASLKTLRYRSSAAPALFFGAYEGSGTLVGFVSATLSESDALDHDSMSTHDPNGSLVCLHSVCVHPSFQRKGIATQLMVQFVAHLKRGGVGKKIAIISHDHLLAWYQSLGFKLLGPSLVAHGSSVF